MWYLVPQVRLQKKHKMKKKKKTFTGTVYIWSTKWKYLVPGTVVDNGYE